VIRDRHRNGEATPLWVFMASLSDFKRSAWDSVLFLDELPEFHPRSLEVVSKSLEQGQVTISRALNSTTFPARFVLVAAMNPCEVGKCCADGFFRR
jgi:hypothetical protein